MALTASAATSDLLCPTCRLRNRNCGGEWGSAACGVAKNETVGKRQQAAGPEAGHSGTSPGDSGCLSQWCPCRSAGATQSILQKQHRAAAAAAAATAAKASQALRGASSDPRHLISSISSEPGPAQRPHHFNVLEAGHHERLEQLAANSSRSHSQHVCIGHPPSQLGAGGTPGPGLAVDGLGRRHGCFVCL